MMARVAGQPRAGQVRRGAAEDRDDGRADGGGDVHRSGVIGEEHPARLEHRAKLPQRSAAGEVDGRRMRVASRELPDFTRGRGCQLLVVRAAQNDPATIRPALDLRRRLHEPFPRPALGRAVFGARIEGQPERAGAE